MNPFWIQMINTMRRAKPKGRSSTDRHMAYQTAKAFREARISFFALLRGSVLIVLGILSAGFGLRSFLLPNGFIDGGATGIALLASTVSSLSLSYLLVLINIPFVFLGYRIIGNQFAIKASISIVGLAIAVAVIPYPEVTHDKLLVSVFGGFFLGAGIGLSVRGGAVLDGTEVLAIYLSRKLGTTIGDIILILNIIIFSTAAYLLSVETALYSIITYLAASKTVDFVIEGIEEYTGVTIVSRHSEEIKYRIRAKLGRGLTVYHSVEGYGRRGHSKSNEIIFAVVTRLEINKLVTEIEKVDPDAFVVMHSIKDTKGGMIKKRPFRE